ncbi:hypothetical protein L1987_10732 [Smallanthus sonchifolius]|uniref:Uncharacterized protein n=1 Tax=Smallanthus sonchifolius TaxID=185202 RepID=A0ACB9J9Y0_9ASTR|nr:hypothetical protein L1987_10732 [Smallanthus sonchifolius]
MSLYSLYCIPLVQFKMGLVEYLTIFFSVVIFLSFITFLLKPYKKFHVLGMISTVLANMHRFHDFSTSILIRNGGTYVLKGPWFANMDMLITTEPSNIHHILSKNFSNYPKGDKFRKMFDIFGDGIFNADGHLWEIHRKTTLSLLKHPNFQSVLETIVWNKVETGLLPVFEFVSKHEMEVDLQEIFQRFTFDTMCMLLLDYDLQSLSLEFPCIPCEKAMPDVEEAILYRHFFPPSLWRLQQILRIGNEKKLSDAWKTIDQFVYECLARKQNDENEMKLTFGLLESLMREFKGQTKFLRDSIVSLMGAGRETTSTTLSWFFYLISQNPTVEDKIRQEIHTYLEANQKWKSKHLDQLVYLHGALCETLRLYPPIPFNHKSPLHPDILPSGHQVNPNTKIILNFYAMGRMKKIWGEDCKEFKPERWISKEGGGIKHQPSYKFPAFNAGPRACLGKDMSFTQMKIVAAKIIFHYHIELVKGHPVFPTDSIILQMKHGLKVRLTKTSSEVKI